MPDLLAAQPRYKTLRAQGHEWSDVRQRSAAFAAHREQTGGVELTLRFERAAASGTPQQDAETDEPWSMSVEVPDRLRVEFVVGGESVVAVFIGASWWSWTPSRGGLTNNGHPSSHHGKGPGEILIAPTGVGSALDLEVVGTTSYLGRDASTVTAIPAEGAVADWDRSAVLHRLGSGADAYELIVDSVTGVILRLEARRRGTPFRVVEITDLAVDRPLDVGMFELDLPRGAEFRDSRGESGLRWLADGQGPSDAR